MSDYIPAEIQVQILKCLPVKSLLRFRCVCKWWNQLIDSQSFLQHHLAVQNQNPRFLHGCEGEAEFMILDPLTLPLFDTRTLPVPGPIEDTPKQYRLAGTLHGIVCLYEYYHNQTSICLWNPSIRKLSTLQFTEFRDTDYHDGASTYSVFWIDPSTKHFKIIIFRLALMALYLNDICDGAIYSSIQGIWKRIPLGDVQDCEPLQECPAVVIGGVAYWRAHRYEEVVVLSFDFGLDRFDIIQAPPLENKSLNHPVLCKWQDTLSLVHLDDSYSYRCDIYWRQEDSWLHMFSFNHPSNNRVATRVLWVLGEMDGRGKVPGQDMQQNSKILSTIGGELVLCDTCGGCISVKSGRSA